LIITAKSTTPPRAAAGDTHCSDWPLRITAGVSTSPNTHDAVQALCCDSKPLPRTLTRAPPETDPAKGTMDDTVGADVYENCKDD
jgi:hypothetical protein